MAAQAASEMIFFIGSVIVSAALVGVFFVSVSEMADSVNRSSAESSAALESSITILNDPAHPVYNATSQDFTLWVKNTGARSLSVNETVVLVDAFTFTNASFASQLPANVTAWGPGVTAVFTLQGLNLTASSDHFLKVVGSHQAEDTFEFYW
jgi:flagellar protein FlaG